jgi:hypothetical protein
MGLDETPLPIFVIAGLYKTSLVESDNPKAPTALPQKQPDRSIQFLGENKKSICLLVNYENEVYLPDNELNFLVSILQACKLNLGDVAIVNYHLQRKSFEQISEQINCDYLLVFGIDITQLGLKQMVPFTIQKVNACSVIVSPAAGELNDNSAAAKLLKSKLWLCLKQLFEV